MTTIYPIKKTIESRSFFLKGVDFIIKNIKTKRGTERNKVIGRIKEAKPRKIPESKNKLKEIFLNANTYASSAE
jgi:hypothetical protein